VPFAIAFQGSSFSVAIIAATSSIHATLITPSANSDAISAQQQPMHPQRSTQRQPIASSCRSPPPRVWRWVNARTGSRAQAA